MTVLAATLDSLVRDLTGPFEDTSGVTHSRVETYHDVAPDGDFRAYFLSTHHLYNRYPVVIRRQAIDALAAGLVGNDAIEGWIRSHVTDRLKAHSETLRRAVGAAEHAWAATLESDTANAAEAARREPSAGIVFYRSGTITAAEPGWVEVRHGFSLPRAYPTFVCAVEGSLVDPPATINGLPIVYVKAGVGFPFHIPAEPDA